jgi:putative SOS response-associated peptidase YedK
MTTRLALSEDPRRLIAPLWLDPATPADGAGTQLDAIVDALADVIAWRPRHNITAPQHVWTVRSGDAMGWSSDPWDNMQVAPMRLGLIPSWANHRKMGHRHTAADTRDLTRNAAYTAPWAHGQRCLVLASGFYATSPKATPKLITHAALPAFAIAAIWTMWPGDEDDDQLIESCALLTTHHPDLVGHTAPILLPDVDAMRRWLDPDASPDTLTALLTAPDTAHLRVRELPHLPKDAPDVPAAPAATSAPQLDLVAAIHLATRRALARPAEQLKLPWLAS